MVQLRFKGFQKNASVDLSVSDGIETQSVNVPGFLAPQTLDTLPLIVTSAGQYAGDTLTVDTGALTGPFSYDWRPAGGGGTLSTDAAYVTSMAQMMTQVECAVTHAGGVSVTPPVRLYMTMSDAAHNADDQDILGQVPHDETTHLFTGSVSADWDLSENWLGGRIPSHGARVVIPWGTTCRYNIVSKVRLDWMRVDGRIDFATDVDNEMLIETINVTRSGHLTIGSGPSDRVQNGVTSRIIWSAQSYRDYSYVPTDIDLNRAPLLWSRGMNVQGRIDVWGRHKFHGCLSTEPVLAGATSLTLEKDPIGWEIGDEIYIAGIEINLAPVHGDPFLHEDEKRVITGISGRTISWSTSEPLLYDHNDKLGLRQDIRPLVHMIRGRNVEMISESKNFWERGQFTAMHRFAEVDLWDMQFIDMGRTNKIDPSGIVDGNGDFRTHTDDDVFTVIDTQPLTARSSVFGKYGAHLHHTGSKTQLAAWGKETPSINRCYVEGTPGWGLVHHACHANLFSNTVHDFFGAGIVAEQGDETGVWSDNITSFCTGVSTIEPYTFLRTPKNMQNWGARHGDSFRYCVGMAYRSRALVVSDNYIANCPFAVDFAHRRGSPNIIDARDHKRENLDLQSIGRMTSSNVEPTEIEYYEYPIQHFNNNIMMGCWMGFFVTKEIAPQFHDAGIRLRHNTVWGCLGRGSLIEYIVNYVIDNWDVAMAGTPVGGWGRLPYQTSTNAFQIAYLNCIAQGRQFAENLEVTGHTGSNGAQDRDVYDPDNRRYYVIGSDFRGLVSYKQPGTQTQAEVVYESDDWDNNELDWGLDPDWSFPEIVAMWNGSSSSGDLTNRVTNADGAKITNFTSAGKLADKPFRDTPFPKENLNARNFCRDQGYYEHNGGWVLYEPVVITDEITGRPAIMPAFIGCTNEPSVADPTMVNNGPLDYVTTPIVQADIRATVAAGGSVLIDVVSEATGGNGTIELHDLDFIAPDRCFMELDTVNGTVTITPFSYVTKGQDEFYVFLRSGDTMFKTVRVSVLIGPAAAPEPPQEATQFTAQSGSGAGEIDITLLARPETGGRNIRLVQYSTDGGSTWRRLTNLWPQTTFTVTHESSGAPLSAGNYTLRLRYFHEHEYANSAPSAPIVVNIG